MSATYQDNRSPADVSEWLHCEVRALRERVRALEAENMLLRAAVEGMATIGPCYSGSTASPTLVRDGTTLEFQEPLRKAVQG